jgi:predicted secreted protein
LNNLTLIAVIIIVLWLVIFLVYFTIVRGQKELEHDISQVESLLAEGEHQEDNP